MPDAEFKQLFEDIIDASKRGKIFPSVEQESVAGRTFGDEDAANAIDVDGYLIQRAGGRDVAPARGTTFANDSSHMQRAMHGSGTAPLRGGAGWLQTDRFPKFKR